METIVSVKTQYLERALRLRDVYSFVGIELLLYIQCFVTLTPPNLHWDIPTAVSFLQH